MSYFKTVIQASAILMSAMLLIACEQPIDTVEQQTKKTAVSSIEPGENTITHGYVDGVTPTNIDRDSAERTYPVIEADWEGPGGDKRWLGANLGATRVANSIDDTSAASAGWYFQFNHKGGIYPDVPNDEKVVQHNAGPVSARQYPSLDSDWVDNDPCRALLQGNWRIPTSDEWKALTESEDAISRLNLHNSGYILGSLSFLTEVGESGYFWSSTQHMGANRGFAVGLQSETLLPERVMLMWAGLPLRCIED